MAVSAFPSVSSIQGGSGARANTLSNCPIANCYNVQIRIIFNPNLLITIDTPGIIGRMTVCGFRSALECT